MVGGTPGVNAGQQCECAAGDEACLLLCRVALGEALVERDYRGNAPGQFWHQLRYVGIMIVVFLFFLF
jgi:hypothetical protein